MNNDLISRQDVVDSLEEQLDYLRMLDKNENPTAEGKWYGVNWARNTIADLPSAQKKGEWIEKTDKYGLSYVCPFCGKEIAGTDLNYCVKCGAEMKGGVGNENN